MRLDFLLELVRRRVTERYIGTTSRLVWVVLSPLIPLLMNLAVFYYIARIPAVQGMGVATYAAFVFSGLLPYRILQRATTEGCDLLTGNLEMLKTSAFPVRFLSLSAVGALMVDLAIQSALMAVLLAIAGQMPGLQIMLLPLALALLVGFALGASWLMSVAGYLMRELQEVVAVMFGALIFVTPAMYPPEAAPAFLRALILFNPLSHYVIIFRDTVSPGGFAPHWSSWMVAGACSAIVLAAGYAAISRMRRHVGDMV
jgi:lipopolysaccharide transport system permease protein